jgi:hypothetical protein
MASAHQLICAAISERRLVTFILDGFRRIAEPHDYGIIDGVARRRHIHWDTLMATVSPRPMSPFPVANQVRKRGRPG